MNYREKQKKTSSDKKLRKLSAYRKKYQDPAAEKLADAMSWEEQANQQILEAREAGQSLLPEEGDELFMTGWAGAAGTLFLADWKRESLCTRFTESFIRTAFDSEVFDNYREEGFQNCMPDSCLEQGASWIAPVGEGGLLRTLYRFGKETDLGFRIQSREVPIRQITIEFCEFFLIHPWELFAGRSFLFAAKHNAPLLRKLDAEGISYRKIGLVTKVKQKLICRGQEESNINRPEPDGLLTLLLEEKGI